MEDKIEKFFRELRKVSLSREEKSALRERVLMKARGFVPAYKETVSRRTFWSAFFSHKVLVAVPVAVLALVGISYGAEGALPGDILYQVKVGLNEPVFHALSLTPESQAGFEVKMAERRLAEASTLLNSGRLDENTRNGLLEAAMRSVDNFVIKAEILSMKTGTVKLASESIVLDDGAVSDSGLETEAGAEGGPVFMMSAVQTGDSVQPDDFSEDSARAPDSALPRVAPAVEDLVSTLQDGAEADSRIREMLNRAGEKIESAKSGLKNNKRDLGIKLEKAIQDASDARSIIGESMRAEASENRGKNNRSDGS